MSQPKKPAITTRHEREFIEALLRAAEQHGTDGDPEHEVGDLQQVVWALWALIPRDAKHELMNAKEWREFIAQHS